MSSKMYIIILLWVISLKTSQHIHESFKTIGYPKELIAIICDYAKEWRKSRTIYNCCHCCRHRLCSHDPFTTPPVLSPDKKHLIVPMGDTHKAAVYDLATGKLRAILGDYAYNIIIDKNSKFAAIGNRFENQNPQYIINIWNLLTLEHINSFSSNDFLGRTRFLSTPNGTSIVLPAGTTLQSYNILTGQLINAALIPPDQGAVICFDISHRNTKDGAAENTLIASIVRGNSQPGLCNLYIYNLTQKENRKIPLTTPDPRQKIHEFEPYDVCFAYDHRFLLLAGNYRGNACGGLKDFIIYNIAQHTFHARHSYTKALISRNFLTSFNVLRSTDKRHILQEDPDNLHQEKGSLPLTASTVLAPKEEIEQFTISPCETMLVIQDRTSIHTWELD